ncbi:hypothetical protein M3Y97_00577700 [Aphelenchoides bicaudatus]|nr:hypothetical protein M3Y97_00577700 [Aphelenchoides bicaudatus]
MPEEVLAIEAGLVLPDEDDIKTMSVDDLNSFLNAAVATLKEETDQLPSEVIRNFIVSCLKCMENYVNEEIVLNVVALSWPADIKTVAQRIFQTYNIGEEYIRFSFMALCLTGQIAGSPWITSPETFFQLIASLSAGRLRIVTENPEAIDKEMLAVCLRLLELCVKCIEDESCGVSDEIATAVGRSSQEAASFCCEYLTACAEQKVELDMEIQLALYRYICLFISIGGAQIINKEFLKGSVPILISVREYALSQDDDDTANLIDLEDLQRILEQ